MAKYEIPNFMKLYEEEQKKSAEFAAMAEGLRTMLRDKIAMAALSAVSYSARHEEVAKQAYDLADAMMKHRKAT